MPDNRPQELLKPIRLRFIYFTFFIALLLELIPVPAGSFRWLPDFVGLLLIYWTINQPQYVGIGTGFGLGILADVFSAGLFGQHALAYSVSTYIAQTRQSRLIMYNLGQQSLVVLGLLLLNQATMMITRLLLGASFVGWSYFFSPLIGALIWPLLTKLLLIPYQYRRK